MNEILHTLILLFAVMDPIGTIPVFLEATKDFKKTEKKKVAINATLTAALVLLFFIIAGQVVLSAMDVSLDAFQVSGGVILFLFALTMIFGKGKPETEIASIQDYKHVTIFPVAIPSIASPGAIIAVVILTDNDTHTITDQFVTTLLVILTLIITGALLLSAKYLQKVIGEYGITVISKIMGLILASYAVQSILIGIKDFYQL